MAQPLDEELQRQQHQQYSQRLQEIRRSRELPDRKEWDNSINIKGLKKGFVENIGQSGPLLVVSKTQGKCQLSVNPIQTLLLLSCLVIVLYNRPLQAKLWRYKPDNRELKIQGRGRGLRGRHLILSFLAYALKIYTPESFIVLFFTTKVSMLISVEEGKALSRSLNDKIPNIW